VKPWPINEAVTGEDIWFVDLSFKKDTAWQLQELLNKGCNITWIDHHTSSMELEKAPGYEWIKEIPGLRLEGVSGAALTWYWKYNGGIVDEDMLPYYMKLVSDYDCWKYKYDPHTTWFKLAMDTTDDTPFASIWKKFQATEIYDKLTQIEEMTPLLNIGKEIKTYVDINNEFYYDNYAYESEIGGLKCIVVNKKSNSWVFGENYSKYPVCVVWVYDGEWYSYSIYSHDKEVDCSKIAESYGGGGHRSAAGFKSKELLFHKK
jgi:oligoribonuclease NrnB/cAMP/cGMP phosphodiesterase (DHH superfamily)